MRSDPRFADRKPKVFVGICAFGDIPRECFESWVAWWGKTCARHKDDFELYFGVSPRKEQYRARNFLVMEAEKCGADFLLMLDDDQILTDCDDMLEKFWELGEPVMGALYWQRGGNYHPVVMKEFEGPMDKTHYRFLHPDELPEEPGTVDVVGHGGMWCDMDVYARLKQPHHWPYPSEEVFVPSEDMGLDVHFCHRVRHELGMEVWLHPGIEMGHLQMDRPSVTSANRPAQKAIEATERYQQYQMSIAGKAKGRDIESAA